MRFGHSGKDDISDTDREVASMMHDMNGWSFGFGQWMLGVVSWLVVILLIAALLKYLFGIRK